MKRSENLQLIQQFWGFARPNRRAYYSAFFLMFLTLGLETVRPFVLKLALNNISDGDSRALASTALIFLLLIVLDYAWRSTFSYLISIAFLKTINRIRDALFRHVLRMKMAFFDKEPVGRLLTRTINDCESLGETLRAGISTIFVDMLSVAVIFGVLVKLDWGLTKIILVTAPAILLVVRWCGSRLRAKYLEVREALADANGIMAEGIAGVEVLQLFRQQEWSKHNFQTANKEYRRATITSNFYDSLLYALIDGFAAIVTAVILMVAFNVRFGLLEVGTLIVFLNQVERMFVPIRDISGKFAIIQQALAALQRIFELLNKPETIEQGTRELPGDRLPIRFRGVDFRYQSDGPKVLQDVSFEVSPGRVIALVGQTGSGKSTIGKLLIRAYDGYKGSIKVGGQEICELNYHSLRSKIAVVQQDVELFPGTLRDNIAMFDPSIAEEKILWAVGLVKAEHMLEQLEGGLDFEVREDGSNLSTGQVQLIVFARALAHDAPIILMDEATSSVDSVTEAWIQEAISQLFRHKTVLIVAHRLSTIAAADTILVLREGRVIERGSHNQLVRIENGYYAGLIEASRFKSGQKEELLVS